MKKKNNDTDEIIQGKSWVNIKKYQQGDFILYYFCSCNLLKLIELGLHLVEAP